MVVVGIVADSVVVMFWFACVATVVIVIIVVGVVVFIGSMAIGVVMV